MTPARAAERLGELGLDSRDIESRRSLFELVLSRFTGRGVGAPEHLFWVPGRLEVFGKHTDYAGGRTLVSAVPRGFAIAARPRRDARIHLADAARGEDVSFDTTVGTAAGTETPAMSTGWRHYVHTVVRRLARNFPGAALGADLVFASDLPRASGMSSSSALMVGVAAALGRAAELERRPEWRDNIQNTLDAASYYACIENGLSFGALAGDAGVGTHGGSEDHAAIVCGKAGRMSAFGFVPMRHVTDVELPEDWRFVLTPSGVAADKTGGARGPYNRLAKGAEVLLRLWNGTEPHASSLATALTSSPDAADRLRALAVASRVEDWPPTSILSRLDHFVGEDARVPLAVAAFNEADADVLGRLAAESQRDAEALLGNQVPQTVALADAARGLGALAACSFGAGFGGSVWALVHGDEAAEFAQRWHPAAFVARPAPPLTVL